MSRNEEGLKQALEEIPAIREEFWENLTVPGSDGDLNTALERAGRVADFLEHGELMCHDALARDESCGAHFRTEHQSEDGEAKRDDVNFQFVSVWEHRGDAQAPALHKEELHFEDVIPSTRSYK